MQNQQLNLTSADIFEQTVQQRIAGAEESLSVLVVDMSDINRLFARSGPAASAMFLNSIAKMLLRVCRNGDTVSRIGDCTFGIILDNVGSPILQQLAAEKIIRLYKTMVNEMDAFCKPGINIGIATYPDSADSAVELLHNARIALESACSNGDPYQVYSAESHAVLETKWALQDIDRATAGGRSSVALDSRRAGRGAAVCLRAYSTRYRDYRQAYQFRAGDGTQGQVRVAGYRRAL